jgi:hypothetical protein
MSLTRPIETLETALAANKRMVTIRYAPAAGFAIHQPALFFFLFTQNVDASLPAKSKSAQNSADTVV